MISKYFLYLPSTLSLLIFASSATADDNLIAIQDTSGVTRASSEIEEFGKVDFNLADATGNPAQGIEVSLTNQATGQTLTSIAESGVASFSGLGAGAWTVACATPGVTFTSVGISSALAGAGGAVGAVGAGTISGAGAAAGAGATGAVVGTSAAVVSGGTLLTAGGVAAAAAGTAVAVDEASDDDDDEVPLSPFS